VKRNLPGSKFQLAALVVLSLAAVGCGGSSGSTESNTDAKLTFTATAGYNGSALRFSGNPTASVTNGSTVVLVSEGARTFTISLPSTSPQNGTVYTVGQNGTNARYTEAILGSSDNVWTGTGGTISVKSLRNTLFLTLTNVTFAADSTNGSQAQGTFTVSGTINNVGF
jgi:hypothetical protein